MISLTPSTIAEIISSLAGLGMSDVFTATAAGDYTFTAKPSGPFSSLVFKLQQIIAYYPVDIATWDALANPSKPFTLKDGGSTYLLKCTAFVGGDSVSVEANGASYPLPAESYLDLQGLQSVDNPAPGQVRIYASSAPSLNAIDSNGNSVIIAGSLAAGSGVDGGTYP